MQKPRIAIIGGGPGGLTLARVLYRNGISAVVFEREERQSVRPQGGSLDMHSDSGQYAIGCAGLRAEFEQIARYEDQETRVYDKHGRLMFEETDVSGKDRPEVDRGELRQMLLDSLPEGMVRWGHELSAARVEDGSAELDFRNGVRERVDLVVGADGAWSRIRPLVSVARPVYSGVMFVECGIDDVDRGHPDLAGLVGRGLMFALGESKAIIAHRDAHAHIGVYAGLRVGEDWVKSGGLETWSSGAMRRSLGEHFTGWSESLLAFIEKCGDRMTPRGFMCCPPGMGGSIAPG